MSASSQCGAGGRVARRCWISWRGCFHREQSCFKFCLGHHAGRSFPRLLHVLSQQASCPSPVSRTPSPAKVHCFPQRMWITTGSRHRRLRRSSTMAGSRGPGRPTPPSSTAAPSSHTAEALPPRRPNQARARMVDEVLPVLRSGRRTGQCSHAQRTRRGCTASTLRWAARRCSGPPSARQRARTDAALCSPSLPPEGRKKEGTGTAALWPVPPGSSHPLPLPVRGFRQSLRSWR